MTIREQFEAFYSDNGKTPHAIEKLPNGEYAYIGAEHAWTVWQACAELKQPELDKANARIAQLKEALKDAIDDIGSWGAYASEYFQQKHNLDGNIKRYEDIITNNQ